MGAMTPVHRVREVGRLHWPELGDKKQQPTPGVIGGSRAQFQSA